MDCSPAGSSVHGNSPGKNTGMGCRALLCVMVVYISDNREHDLCLHLKNREFMCACMCMCYSLSCVRLFAIPWTVARQAPLSIEFSRKECWSGLPFPSLGDLPDPGNLGVLHCSRRSLLKYNVWISHGFTCIPHPDPHSHLSLHPIPLGLPSAPGPSTCLIHPAWAGDLFHPR